MFCISVSSLFWYHVYLVLSNRSTLEQFRAPYFATGPDESGWGLGKRNNFQVRKKSVKVEKISDDSLDSIPSPSVKIQIMGRKGYLR